MTDLDGTGTMQLEVGSLSSNYTDSGEENGEHDIKAIQFFSKENTARMNIAQQKMHSWITKMKAEFLSLSPKPRISRSAIK